MNSNDHRTRTLPLIVVLGVITAGDVTLTGDGRSGAEAGTCQAAATSR
jgi:hypothetical protein